MPYIITDTSGETEITIPDGGLNNDFVIDLIGRNYENYGSVIAKTQIGLLENFANDIPPKQSLGSSGNHRTGQLWYDTGSNIMRVYDSTNGSWKPQTPVISSGAPSNTYNQIVDGFMYFDTSLSQLYIYNNGAYYKANATGTISDQFSSFASIGNPTEYGTNVRNIFLYDTGGTPRNVLAVVSVNNGSGQPNLGSYYKNEQLIAIFSTHDEFIVSDTPQAVVDGVTHAYGNQLGETGGIGFTIKPGVNVRKDSTTVTNYANHSERSEAAYKINTGSFSLTVGGSINDNAGANIDGGNLYHRGANVVADTHDTYSVGSSSTTFKHGYFTDISIGNGTQGNILFNGASDVSIGSTGGPVRNMYVTDIIVSGNLEFIGGTSGNIGSETTPIANLYADNTVSNSIIVNGNVSYALPHDGLEGQRMVLREDSGELFAAWEDPINRIQSINEDSNKSINISITNVQEDYDALRPNGSTVAYSDTYDRLEISANIDYIQSTFSSGTGISYNDAGRFTLNYPNPFKSTSDSSDNWDYEPADFVQTGSVTQSISGEKTFVETLTLTTGADFGSSGQIFHADTLRFVSGSSYTLTLDTDGNLEATSDITAFSDRRLKTDLKQIDNALDKVSALTGYTYTRTDTGAKQTGLIAQDLQQVLPEAVHENADGILSVAYGNTVGLLVEAIKDLHQQVTELQSKLDEK